MAILKDEDLLKILKTNPNKPLLDNARSVSSRLTKNILGTNSGDLLSQNTYFENSDIYSERTRNVTSNADLFARLLAREEMVFSAKGGSVFYEGLSEEQTATMTETLDNIRFNMSIRKWVKEFALQAYRVDPMGVFFVEIDNGGKSYPTYKSTECIFDYQTNGRKLEYIIFRLKPNDIKQLVIVEYQLPEQISSLIGQYTNYYRVVDDVTDKIVKLEGDNIEEIETLINPFQSVPAIIASDLIDFKNNKNFVSPLYKTIELAETFIQDRSIRDLSKKYNGFAKGFEPILECATCLGTGLLSGNSCPDCTPSGADRGTGKKLRTKVADIARFPLPPPGQPNNVNPADFFGYITPPIEIWDKQDTSLNDIESTINDTYWGTSNKQSTTGPTTTDKGSFKETATKTLADLKPVYSRLNMTADWAETTENALCDFIGFQLFGNAFKSSGRTYGRYYILETPDELMEQYLDMKVKGAPQSSLFDVLRKYYHAVYESDPIQLAIKLKLVDVEPFVHSTLTQVQALNPTKLDFFSKMYFSEWLSTKQNSFILVTTTEKLVSDLQNYATKKMSSPEELLVPPSVSVTDAIKTTN